MCTFVCVFIYYICMRQGMLTLSGAPSTTSQIGY